MVKEKKLLLGHILIHNGGLSGSIAAQALLLQCSIREGSMLFDDAAAELRFGWSLFRLTCTSVIVQLV